MSKVEGICEQWQDVRDGLIKEVELIPSEQMGFKPAPESRTAIEILHHIVETQRVLAGEMCRENTNFQRGVPALIADFAGNAKEATTRESVLDLLRSSLEETKAMVVSFGDANFEKGMTRFDGKRCTKLEMLNLTMAHEMYHRGQLTVYERLLGIEPAFTQFLRKMSASS